MLLCTLVLFLLSGRVLPQSPAGCTVAPLGGGQDDGPNINTAFKTCSNNSVIILDSYYVVDTLLFTTNLNNVDIVLSGTSEFFLPFYYCIRVVKRVMTVQYTPDIAKWSPQSYFLTYQNACVLPSLELCVGSGLTTI